MVWSNSRFLLLAVVGLFAIPASAQGFRPGPMRGFQVRSPFFQMDVSPYGTSVRAPGASVDVPSPAVAPYGVGGVSVYSVPCPYLGRIPLPGYFAARPYLPNPAAEAFFRQHYSTDPRYPLDAPEIAPLNAGPSADRETEGGDVWLQLAASAERLRAHLAYNRQGESWLKFLNPDRVMQFAEMGQASGQLDPQGLAEMRQLLSHYTGTENSAEFAWVVRTPGFRETRALLESILASAENSPGEPTLADSPQPLEPQPPAPRRASEVPQTVPPNPETNAVPQSTAPKKPDHPESRLEELPAPPPASSGTRASF